MSGDLVPAAPAELVHPDTGELLEATAENASVVLLALRERRDRLNEAVKAVEAIVLDEASLHGRKTLRFGRLVATVSGGPGVVWDVEKLRAGLKQAGCPQERIDELITTTVEYKVDGTVARQLATNPAYAKAIAAAKGRDGKPFRVNVKQEGP